MLQKQVPITPQQSWGIKGAGEERRLSEKKNKKEF